jgi:hypothetical protein
VRFHPPCHHDAARRLRHLLREHGAAEKGERFELLVPRLQVTIPGTVPGIVTGIQYPVLNWIDTQSCTKLIDPLRGAQKKGVFKSLHLTNLLCIILGTSVLVVNNSSIGAPGFVVNKFDKETKKKARVSWQ